MGGHLEMRQRQVEWPPELGATVTAPEELSLPTLQYLCKPVWLKLSQCLNFVTPSTLPCVKEKNALETGNFKKRFL